MEVNEVDDLLRACQWRDGDVFLQIHVRPGAKQDRVEGLHDGAIKLRIKAPAADGKANDYLLKLLAGQFGVPQSAAGLTKGRTSRRKTVRIKQPRQMPDWLAKPLAAH